ncbi:UPF0202 protein [Acorus calamus]|uniref:RNA cytidine acetyltransferase n=1 Tax=Acorus calamus TaxID=4465 RepID=A0AAV9F835_ACOCL|nr:UPF0202 protein [Acorus calamus]
MRKKVDERIRTLIENGVKMRHRSMFIIVGDKSRDQIVNLHHMLSKAVTRSRPTVLWCYKDKLELSSHKRKRGKQIKKLMQKGLLDPEKVDPFQLFMETGGVSFCLYRDSERVLGNTYGMCILQDFEALTPNLLARTIETVEGGGLVVLLLRSLSSLTSLYTMVMDVHDRFRTESHSDTVARFNERFLLSMATCKACIVMDDELNILPISSHIRSIVPVSVSEVKILRGCREQNGMLYIGPGNIPLYCELTIEYFGEWLTLYILSCFEQGKAVITFLDAILDKTLRSTVALLAARGRGKSAALGLAIAGAIAAGYSNIFVTALSPENLKTLFEFACKGLNELKYKERSDYDVVQSSNPDYRKATVRINIYKQHRQTIQYLQPHEHGKLSQVELLVIDEAAAIPLPLVKSMLGPYLVFMSSTVNGYEGTGRSLSLKLLQQMEEQSVMPAKSGESSFSGRLFKRVELSESIRYASGDPIESWLNGLLCLDVSNYIPKINRLPHPDECNLYYVNRDTLFSYHKDSELFLQRMMALYVASHYKNSPNDLQLMADAPAHHLFVLLGPVDETKNQLPDILCVIQVCLEGKISRESAIKSLSDGHQPHGDQLPWKFCEQFQDTVFPGLSGARIVRIAVHPSAMRSGYGSAAVELLTKYYEGQLTNTAERDAKLSDTPQVKLTEAAEKASLLEETVKPRANLPPLLVHLTDRIPEKLHYLGVSFGLTHDLFRFWRRHKFTPFYIGQIASTVTGEHTCMVLKPLNNDEIETDASQYGFLLPFFLDFRKRFMRLLGSSFRMLDYKLAMSILDPKITFMEAEPSLSTSNEISRPQEALLSPYDMKRLEAYANHLTDYHMILDLVPFLAQSYFQEKLPVTIRPIQASILLCMGLQNQDLTYTEKAIGLGRQQILAYFIKTMKKLYKHLYSVAAKEIDSTLPRLKDVVMTPHSVSLDEDLNDAAKKVEDKMTAEMNEMLNPDYLQQYAIVDREADFEIALQSCSAKIPPSGLVSVKSSMSTKERHVKEKEMITATRKEEVIVANLNQTRRREHSD